MFHGSRTYKRETGDDVFLKKYIMEKLGNYHTNEMLKTLYWKKTIAKLEMTVMIDEVALKEHTCLWMTKLVQT